MIKPKIFAIIPARSGSKGIADKNIKLLNGKPLLAYSIQSAIRSRLIDRVIVSTDSQQYADIAQNYGAEVPFLRPKNISGDKAKDIHLFDHLITWFRDYEKYVPDYLVHLRPTSPLRKSSIIDDAITLFINSGSKFTSLRSCHAMPQSSYKTFEIKDKKLKGLNTNGFDIESLNNPRQGFPTTYDCNGYVDIIRSELISDKDIMHGDSVLAFITELVYEIDEKSDFDLIEHKINLYPEYFQQLFGNVQ